MVFRYFSCGAMFCACVHMVIHPGYPKEAIRSDHPPGLWAEGVPLQSLRFFEVPPLLKVKFFLEYRSKRFTQ